MRPELRLRFSAAAVARTAHAAPPQRESDASAALRWNSRLPLLQQTTARSQSLSPIDVQFRAIAPTFPPPPAPPPLLDKSIDKQHRCWAHSFCRQQLHRDAACARRGPGEQAGMAQVFISPGRSAGPMSPNPVWRVLVKNSDGTCSCLSVLSTTSRLYRNFQLQHTNMAAELTSSQTRTSDRPTGKRSVMAQSPARHRFLKTRTVQAETREARELEAGGNERVQLCAAKPCRSCELVQPRSTRQQEPQSMHNACVNPGMGRSTVQRRRSHGIPPSPNILSFRFVSVHILEDSSSFTLDTESQISTGQTQTSFPRTPLTQNLTFLGT